jgi:SAM-dependent methyltransferase
LVKLRQKLRNRFFPGSAVYWEKRYRNNGHSGNGSYAAHAAYKASFLNHFVKEKKINRVIELGCGDGNQIRYFEFEQYTGIDVSTAAIRRCKKLFERDEAKSFFLYPAHDVQFSLKAELAISLDVIYHLVEDEVYMKYMYDLFSSAEKFVIIYAWDVEGGKNYHVRHRQFSKWVSENIRDFKLIERVVKEPFCDFFVYQRLMC